jgi:hypothetical protein
LSCSLLASPLFSAAPVWALGRLSVTT